jgi:hypothetical protein
MACRDCPRRDRGSDREFSACCLLRRHAHVARGTGSRHAFPAAGIKGLERKENCVSPSLFPDLARALRSTSPQGGTAGRPTRFASYGGECLWCDPTRQGHAEMFASVPISGPRTAFRCERAAYVRGRRRDQAAGTAHGRGSSRNSGVSPAHTPPVMHKPPVIASAAKQSRAQKKELDRFVGFASSR